MTKKLPLDVKQSRKPTRVACTFCHSKHLQCDSERPCKNCVKRGLGDSCQDVVRRRNKQSAKLSKREKNELKLSQIKSKIPGSDQLLLTNTDPNKVKLSVATEAEATTPGLQSLISVIPASEGERFLNLPNISHAAAHDSTAKAPIIENPGLDNAKNENGSTAPIKRKRGRPPKNKSLDPSKPTIKKKTGSTKTKKLQKLNNSSKKNMGEKNVTQSIPRQKEDLSGLGVYTPTATSGLPHLIVPATDNNGTSETASKESSNILNRKASNTENGLCNANNTTNASNSHLPLLNLANISLSGINLHQLPSIPVLGNSNLSLNGKQENQLNNMRLPSFSDLKTPLFSGFHDARTPQFDIKLPFSPVFNNSAKLNDVKGTEANKNGQVFSADDKTDASEENINNKNSNRSNNKGGRDINGNLVNTNTNNGGNSRITDSKNSHGNASEGMAMLELPSLSSTGLQNLLNSQINDPIITKTQPINMNNSSVKDEKQIPLNMMIPASTKMSQFETNSSARSIDPETPGSPLEFSVSSATRSNTTEKNNIHSNPTFDSRFTSQDMISSNSSTRNFESNVANDEYIQLTDLLNTNPPTPSTGFMDNGNKAPEIAAGLKNKLQHIRSNGASPLGNVRSISPAHLSAQDFNSNNNYIDMGVNAAVDDSVFGENDDDDDDDKETRPFISINLEDGTMISSYPNNMTPNSFVYNADHSKMPNTAKEIPKDFEQNDDYTSPLIMRHVIKQPDDIYLTNIVKAYQYPKAYHALIAYLKKRFNKRQLLEIAKCMAKYRPSFISATKNLFENDLIFTERSFQRTLLEYENLIAMSPSPTIIWRRTGEIVALTNEFAVMTGYSKMSLLTKRTFIVELMDDESTINYFRSFSEFAFGDLNATYLTDCNLRKAEEDNYLRCCCVWTIKRDVFDIPMLIVGQFLPVL